MSGGPPKLEVPPPALFFVAVAGTAAFAAACLALLWCATGPRPCPCAPSVRSPSPPSTQ